MPAPAARPTRCGSTARHEASPRPLAAGQIGGVTGIAASPDGSRVAVAAHDGRLRVVDVASGTVTEMAAGTDGPCDGLSWSAGLGLAGLVPARPPALAPDPPGPPRRIPPTASRAPRWPRSSTSRTAGSPTPTRCSRSTARHLAFLSQRSFDPVYDTQSFDMSFPYGTRPFLVPLAADTPSPFGPLPDGRPLEPGSGDGHGSPGEPDASGGEGSPRGRRPTGRPVRRQPGRRRRAAGRRGARPARSSRTASRRASFRCRCPRPATRSCVPWPTGSPGCMQPLSGVLGEGGASPDAPPRRASLERFDLAKRECTELRAEARRLRGQRRRQVGRRPGPR